MAAATETAFLTIIILGMLVGLFSLLLVFVPGVIIIWLSILAYGLVTGFNWASGIIFGVITALMIFSTVIDNVIMGATTRQQGTSWLAFGAILLTLLVGLLLSFVALFLVELLRVKDWRKALASVGGMAKGCGFSVFVRIGIGLLMIGLWVLWSLAIYCLLS